MKLEPFRYFLCAVIFLFVFGVYVFTMSPGLTSDDSGELSGVCATLGIAHPSGYPLYSIFGKIIHIKMPFGNAAYKTNLVAAFFGGMTAAVVFLIVSRWSAPAAVVSALILSFTPQFWNMATVTEVYTINALFAALILLLMVSGGPEDFNRRFCAVSFLSGLALGDHLTIVLIFPAIAVWAALNWREFKNRPAVIPVATALFLIGLSVYAFIPIRAQRNPVYSWEDPKTFDRFIYLVTRQRYGGQLAQGNPLPFTPALAWANLSFFAKVLVDNFTLPGAVIVLGAAAAAFIKKTRKIALLMLIATFTAGPGFFMLARVPLGPQVKDLLERFVYLSFVPLAVAFGAGIAAFPRLKNYSFALAALPAFMLVSNFAELNRRSDFVYYDYAKNILRAPAPGALVFSDRADETEFCCSYLIRIHGRRKDVEFIDCNAGVSKSIYGDDYYRIWGKPRLERRLKVESAAIARAFAQGKDIFYSTFEPEMIPVPRVRRGLLCRVLKSQGQRAAEFFRWSELSPLRAPLPQDLRSNYLYEGNYYLLGRYYLDCGRPDEAQKQYLVPAIIYSRPSALLEIPYWYFQRGRYREAEREYASLLSLKPGWPEVYINLGVVYEKQSKIREAEGSYLKAVGLDPEYVQAYYNLGVLYWKTGDWKKVAQNFEKVVELQPDNTEARKYLAIAQEKGK